MALEDDPFSDPPLQAWWHSPQIGNQIADVLLLAVMIFGLKASHSHAKVAHFTLNTHWSNA
jgi:hypothetical protein